MSKQLHTCMYRKIVWFFQPFDSLLESVCTQKGIEYSITLQKTRFLQATYKFWMRADEKTLRQAEKELHV